MSVKKTSVVHQIQGGKVDAFKKAHDHMALFSGHSNQELRRLLFTHLCRPLGTVADQDIQSITLQLLTRGVCTVEQLREHIGEIRWQPIQLHLDMHEHCGVPVTVLA